MLVLISAKEAATATATGNSNLGGKKRPRKKEPRNLPSALFFFLGCYQNVQSTVRASLPTSVKAIGTHVWVKLLTHMVLIHGKLTSMTTIKIYNPLIVSFVESLIL